MYTRLLIALIASTVAFAAQAMTLEFSGDEVHYVEETKVDGKSLIIYYMETFDTDAAVLYYGRNTDTMQKHLDNGELVRCMRRTTQVKAAFIDKLSKVVDGLPDRERAAKASKDYDELEDIADTKKFIPFLEAMKMKPFVECGIGVRRDREE
jgi:hypothetical protein